MKIRKKRGVARERGVALVIALVLLLIITLFATGGMVTATAELTMAGNEQFHRRAIDAASAGIEVGIARLAPATGETAAGQYAVTSRYVGEEATLPGFSADKFSARHFEIESVGTSARNAQDRQFQGVMQITSRGSTETFTRLGAGLSDS